MDAIGLHRDGYFCPRGIVHLTFHLSINLPVARWSRKKSTGHEEADGIRERRERDTRNASSIRPGSTNLRNRSATSRIHPLEGKGGSFEIQLCVSAWAGGKSARQWRNEVDRTRGETEKRNPTGSGFGGWTIHGRFMPKSNIRPNYAGVGWDRGRRK